jgi:DNA-binding transcriptional ArsR family regulator
VLAAAHAAERWMTAGIVELPNPLQALLAAAGLLVGTGVLRTVIPPLWAAYPILGQQSAVGGADALPRLRSDVAARLAPVSAAPGWLLAFLHLLAEGARIALRELDRLLSVAEQGRALSAGCDRRSRFSHALDAVLRAPVLTPKALAAELGVAPQTATALLRELRGAKLVTEVTGRRSFRAFAVVA